MALARSASGPGGLSINTSTANNLFGSSSNAAPAAGGLFGAASQPQSSQPATGSGLFGAAASTTPKPGGLFGSSTTPAAAPAQTPKPGGLFGSAPTATTTTSQPSGGGLFGSTPAAQPQQQSAVGGLFGNAASATQQPAQTGGLFGGAATNTVQPQQQQQQQQQQQTGGGGGGIFGSSLLGGNQQKPSAFGSTLNNQPTTGLGGGLGQSTNQQPVPGVRIDISNLRGTTRFNDLQEDLQKVIVNFDQQIQSWISQKNELDAFMPAHGEMLSNIPNDVKFVQTKYDGVQTALRSDAEAIEQVQTLIQQDADHARLSFRAVDNLKLPQQYHTTGLWSSRSPQGGSANNETDGQDIVNFFSKTADEMDDQLKRYEKNLTEIELHMHGIQGNLVEQLQRMMATKNGGASPADEKLAELGAVLRDFEQSILEVAQQVGASREGMTRLQLGDFIPNAHSRSGVY